MLDDGKLERAVERLERAWAAGEIIHDEGDFIARAVQQECMDRDQTASSSSQDKTPHSTS